MEMPEWKAVSETVTAFHKKWLHKLASYDASKSLEDIGREREKWCIMRAALELLFREFNECIAAYEKSLESAKESGPKKLKIKNPYREEN